MPTKIHLEVADPCHENWNSMTIMEQGRHCQSCQKTVTDFSMMTDKEILNHLSQRNADVCGKFTADQLDRTLIGEHKKKFSWSYVWNFVIATFLTVNYASAQQTTGRPTKAATTNKVITANKGAAEGEFSFVVPNGIRKIEGVIVDSKTNLPIPFASVAVKGTTNGVTADVNGKFSLSVFFASNELTLQVSCVSYTTGFFTISNMSSGAVSFYLESQRADLTGPISVGNQQQIGKETCAAINLDVPLQGTIGFVILKETVPVSKKIERQIDDFTSGLFRKREMSVYPNPQIAGGSVNISIVVKNAGDYIMEILDEQSRLVYRQQIELHSKTQTVSVATNALWSKGVYWVRLTGKDSKKIIHSKLMIK